LVKLLHDLHCFILDLKICIVKFVTLKC